MDSLSNQPLDNFWQAVGGDIRQIFHHPTHLFIPFHWKRGVCLSGNIHDIKG
jgi:hypothetical protein